MRLKKLFYEHLGGTPYYLRNFYHPTEYIDDRCSHITQRVIRLLFGDLPACDDCCHDDSRIEAVVQIEGKEYTIRVVFHSGVAKFCVTDDRNIDCTLWYLQTVAHTREEQELPIFYQLGQYPVWLDQSDYALQRFAREFQPERLLPGKNYWLHLEEDGRFTVRLREDGREISDLSEAEMWAYHFLCFIHVLRFWSERREQRSCPAVKKPVLIWDFSGRLDESVDINALFARAKVLHRQVLIIRE